MRLHALEVTAFGPFADTVEVDFEALSDAGLFLLSGPTGAGKTSVLDAVCFALYGDVPGDRGSAKNLRCDLAPPDRAPRVFLDATIGGRRFHLTRSPGWERPKKRGTGTTRQQASVLVQEVVDGEPVHLTNRLDEAGHLVHDLLGMRLGQFTQVVMLPQGRFQDFLRATSEDRHRLLQQLFRTRRFEQVELWLRQRRTELHRASNRHGEGVLALVHRLREAAGEAGVAIEPSEGGPDPDGDLTLAVAERAADGSLLAWVREVRDATAAAERASATRLEEAGRTAAQADRDLAAGRELAERRRRWQRARDEERELDEQVAQVQELRRRIEAAGRAAPVLVVHDQVHRARSQREESERRRQEAARAVADLVAASEGEPDALHSAAGPALEERRTRLGEARALAGVEADLQRLREECAEFEARVAGGRTRVADLERRVTDHPSELRTAEEEHARARAASERLPRLREEARDLERLEQRHAELEQTQEALRAARQELAAAVDAHQRLREQWLDVQEERLTGMAAELASALAAGAHCPVCGSSDHPSPATPSPGTPGRDEERAARREAETADAHRQAHQDHVRTLETRQAHLAELVADSTRDAVARRLGDLRSEIEQEASVAARLANAADHLDRVREVGRTLEADLGDARVELASLTSTSAGLVERERREAARLADGLGGRPDVAALVEELVTDVSRLEELVAAIEADRAAASAAADLAAYLAEVAHDAGFPDAPTAVAAAVPADELDDLRVRVEAHDRARARVTGILADPEVREAADHPDPDLAALEEAHRVADEARAGVEGHHRLAADRADRTRRLHDDLVPALAAWAPVREEHETVAGLAALAEGKSGDNAWQMRLSAYVLARRLGQVVAAANERLATMSDRRYTLEHTAQRGAGERRGGLSLRIVDDWSGEARDPVTLSGGETFVVSLALALGLTDVVTQEAGGTEVGTLFVDEGFGSLDADTLDDVMDTLDGLREGGRVVGIVSHVTELRDRIPAQLHVGKARTGSTLVSTRAHA